METKVLNLITGEAWKKLSLEDQDEYINAAFEYWREKGFPYNNPNKNEIYKQFQQISNYDSKKVFLPDNHLSSTTIGLALANSFHPQIWDIPFSRHRTPIQCFFNDDILKACIKQALNLWPDRKGASESCLRDILRTYRHTRRVSNFRPTVAKAIFERYSKQGDRILDFSAGFSGRLLGCLPLERHYVGYDPCEAQVKGLLQTYETLREFEFCKGTVDIRKVCAEDEIINEGKNQYALIFSSPPYFDCERYSTEPTQSYLRYRLYQQWRDRFLKTVVTECHRVLKRKGYLVINVADVKNTPIATDTFRFCSSLYKLRTIYQLRMSTLPFQRDANQNIQYHCEPVFVFQKG